MSHASLIMQDYDGCTRAQKLRTNMTDFSWLQNCAIDKDDCFMSDGRVFHSDGPATEKLRGPKPTVLVLGTVRSP